MVPLEGDDLPLTAIFCFRFMSETQKLDVGLLVVGGFALR